MKILLAEDDTELGDGVAASLRRELYAVDWVTDGQAASAALKTAQYDLVILDIGLPRLSGLQVLREMRSRPPSHAQAEHLKTVPVMIATAMDAVNDRVDGLDAGADDYLVKPFALGELHARVRALIRRRHAASSNQLVHGPLCFDLASRQASAHGVPLELSVREACILELLLLRTGRAVTKEQLLEALCAWDGDISLNAIEVYVHRLRKKLEPAGIQVRTFRGLGYCIHKLPASAGQFDAAA
ncbi:DNA-binding response regulator [Corticibacter populi]|uniref:DNA-binding response regulator n=1 Tax=Corticibacter populi TaxID=1550736 RepID=A0A3M6QRU5_9BURK|nr:response regulator transcription factor [Corticibacter populi]RMX05764.1 DNA-binding response regulator [Corticibacter populi]RZS30932.1 winged helix family two component transcriptional regulator [Corticibacter populi]